MAGWKTHEGQAVVLARDNVDTDQLIPARFMSAPRTEGYGNYLLHDVRRDEIGALALNFPLNAKPDTSILIAGNNFGSGSSREAAVYALVDAGFRAVIAPSFGDIFASNAVNNGLLPAQVNVEDMQALADLVSCGPGPLVIDLEASSISNTDHTFPFTLPDNWRTKLINGWDDIDLTLQYRDKITAFRTKRYAQSAWALPTTKP